MKIKSQFFVECGSKQIEVDFSYLDFRVTN